MRKKVDIHARKMDNYAAMHDQDLPRKFEYAILAFEKASGLSVSLHPLDRDIWPFLPTTRFLHTSVACLLAKSHDAEACMKFDQAAVRHRLARDPRGLIKICHAGLLEWVVPVGPASTPQLVLFAGQALPGGDLESLGPLRAARHTSRLSAKDHALLGPLTAAEARYLLELLEQLGCRLARFLEEIEGASDNIALPLDQGDRQRTIERFIQHHHTRPITIHHLAERFGLSVSRTTRIVRQACGQSFVQILTDTRIRTAASLLIHTHLSVLEVAEHSGFGDLSNFFRHFRKQTGQTPLAYRRQHRVTTPLSISATPKLRS